MTNSLGGALGEIVGPFKVEHVHMYASDTMVMCAAMPCHCYGLNPFKH